MRNINHILNKYPIEAAYLFGSRSNGRVGPMSDYDFGVLIKDKINPAKYLEIKSALISDLMRALKSNAVDVVLLNESPLLLRYEILKNGRLIYDRKPAKRAAMTFEVINRYLDWKYFEDRLAGSLIKRAAKEGLNV